MNEPIDIDELLRFFGLECAVPEMISEDLSAVPREEWFPGMKVAAPPIIERYLDGEEHLAQATVDSAEIAIEKANGIVAPWFITSICEGREDLGTLKVQRFVLMKEVPGEESAQVDLELEALLNPNPLPAQSVPSGLPASGM